MIKKLSRFAKKSKTTVKYFPIFVRFLRNLNSKNIDGGEKKNEKALSVAQNEQKRSRTSSYQRR